MRVGDLVAVYGSLRYGMGNHRVVEGAERGADGIISGKFHMVSLGMFPGLLKSESPTDIVVEVYKIDTESRAQSLDWLEGYPSFYDREQVQLVDGRTCWVYFLHSTSPANALVPSGDWVSYRAGV